MTEIIDITGQKFGRLTALILDDERGKPWSWICICECGASHTVIAAFLMSGKTKSCGCLRRDRFKTHGMSKTRVYRIWQGMIARCTNTNRINYPRYGGRGIRVCEKWLTFEGFYADMGDDNGLTLERVNNSGNYTASNCKWATTKEQAVNTRSNRLITINRETKTLSQWAEISTIQSGTILARLNLGWSNKDSVFGELKCNPPKINTECAKVIRYFHGKGFTQVRLAKAHNVSRQFIAKVLAGGDLSLQL